jgi:DNA-binding CsgD family transcriptional regulator
MAAMPEDLVRGAEWRRVCEFAATTRGGPALLAITGEAGAGKSTLWRAGVKAAAAAGHQVLRSEPSAAEADLSFAGLSDLLDGVLPAVDADIPGPQLHALQVALLLRAPAAEPPSTRGIGLAVLAALRNCASASPVLIAIDDAQWLDEASLDALAFALRRLDTEAVSVLVAARCEAAADPRTAGTPRPPANWRVLLSTVPTPEEIELKPLDSWQVQRLLPASVTAAQAREVAQQARGNPFWAIQIAANLDAAGISVPPVALALTQRLHTSLTAPAAEALAVVAAAGRITVPGALAILDRLDDPAEALDSAVLAGVVVEEEHRLAPAHPLIGAAAVESLPPGRRQRIYQRLAEASTNPERVAHFAALAADPGPDTRVAEALDCAVAAAHARGANAAASEFAVQAVKFCADPDQLSTLRRRIRASELLFLSGEVERSLQQVQMIELTMLGPDELDRALPLLLDMTELVHGAAAATAIIHRVAGQRETDARRRALVMALASDVVYGIPGGRRAAAAEAIRCAEAAGSAANATLHRALLNLVIAKVTAGEGLDDALLERAEALEAVLPVQRLHDTADVNRGLWSRFLEDLDHGRVSMRRCIERAREADDDFTLATFLSYLAATEELAGDYAAATAAMAERDAAAAWHSWPPVAFHLEPRCQLLIAAGNLEEAVSLAAEYLPDRDDSPAVSRFVGERVRGLVSMWRGEPASAAAHLERAAVLADQLDWADPGVRYRVDPALAEAYVALGRPDEARRIASRLREVGERLRRPALVGDAARIEALAAAEAGDLDRAADLARAAVTAHGSSALRLELARSLLALSRIERRRKARRQARTALRQALELASELGHRPLLREIALEQPRIAAVRSDTELTATEQRVADLIAGGATNRDAAAALFVSVRTVETHVASIYRKLGVKSRAELARRLSGTSSL